VANLLLLYLPKSVFFLYFHFGWFGTRKTPPPTFGVPCTQMTGVFNCKKTPNPSPTICKDWGCNTVFACIQPTYSSCDPCNWCPRSVEVLFLNLLLRFLLNRYSSWQVNILSAYSALSPQATRTVVCFLGGV